MADSFDIELTTRLKVNKLGRELCYLGGFFIAVILITMIPANYMPAEMAFLYIFFIIPRNFHLILWLGIILLLIGDWLSSRRKAESAKLRVFMDKMTIESASKNWDIPYDQILKFKGTPYFTNKYRKLIYTILLKDKTRIEIRTSDEIYNELTDYFPDKV